MYRPQLDGLRALAAAAVCVDHFCGLGGVIGAPAVRLFFVLSGYLITGILLQNRDSLHRGKATAVFYYRRSLRIFPVYYATLIVALLLGLSRFDDHAVWYATYTTNFLLLTGDAPTAGHFWSLAVEEQFYLVWPWLMIYCGRKWLGPILVAAVAIGPLSRCALLAYGVAPEHVGVVTTSCLDSLGMGALLAFFPLVRFSGLIGVPIAIAFPSYTFGALGQAMIFTSLVSLAASGWMRPLQISPLIGLGKISYGVYVYHWFVLWLVPVIFVKLGWSLGESLRLVLLSAVTLTVSVLSWYLLEKPFLSLKDRFKSQSSTSPAST